MKKLILTVLTVLTVAAMGATGAAAACHDVCWNSDTVCRNQSCRYIDADLDGVCDSCGGEGKCLVNCGGCEDHYVDADGDGVCDYAGTGCHFADENGDGICDLCGSRRQSSTSAAASGTTAATTGACRNVSRTCGTGRHHSGHHR